MAQECGHITAGLIAAACGKAPASGTNRNVVLLNFEDIDREASVVVGNVAKSIVLKSGKKGYLFQSNQKATSGSATFARGPYFDTFDHSVVLRAFTKRQSSKDFMNSLIGSRAVAIIDNNEQGDAGETKYEVYGWDSGLTLSELPWATEFSDSVVYSATLASDDASKEGQLPLSFFSTSLADTEQALASLYGE